MSASHPPNRSGGSLKVILKKDPADRGDPRGMVVMVCGGGGAKAAAHVGALRALEEANLVPGHFLGTSMGGVFGGYRGACSVLHRCTVTLGKDIADWVKTQPGN